jgi:hypothetical protein
VHHTHTHTHTHTVCSSAPCVSMGGTGVACWEAVTCSSRHKVPPIPARNLHKHTHTHTHLLRAIQCFSPVCSSSPQPTTCWHTAAHSDGSAQRRQRTATAAHSDGVNRRRMLDCAATTCEQA